MMKFLLGAAAALALVLASPASASPCGDCKNCPNHKEHAAQAQKAGTVAEADKKDQKGCHCVKDGKKECGCGEKCACADCPVHGKKGEKAEKKS